MYERRQKFVRGVRADILFFSSQALNDEGVISDASEEETALRRAMLEAAKQSYFLCDGSKRGKEHTFVVCNAEEITGIIGEE